MSFDQLNVISKSEDLYRELDDINKKAFLEIAQKTYQEINPKSEKKLDLAWLLTILLRYDPVTKYVYDHEVDRKRARFAESLIASKTKSKEFLTALNLWWKQTSQYGITVADTAVIQAYTDLGVKKVMWNTAKDDKVCKICKSRNKKIYPIDRIPDKPHYGCRCWFTPVEVKKDG